jgi:hypothetical protein
VREAFGYLFGPPGWSPDGSRLTSRRIKERWRAFIARESGAPVIESGKTVNA